MKTEQEQTKQMLKTLCDKFQCSAIDRSYMAKSCRQCEDIIEALHEAGYGDVSEYKAEIEQLKENLKNLKDDFESLQKDYEFVRDCDAEHCLEIEETVKQAKIDVLNELKEKCKFDGHTVAVYKNDIEEMIRELKK